MQNKEKEEESKKEGMNHFYEIRIHNRNLKAFIKDENTLGGHQTCAPVLSRHWKEMKKIKLSQKIKWNGRNKGWQIILKTY